MHFMRNRNHPFRIFWLSGLLTALVGIWILSLAGIQGLWILSVLIIVELTFSFDNAIINSKVLATLSPFWQKIFLTIGIFIAVFVVRFLLPIVIVMLAGQIPFAEVINLAFNDPAHYSEILHKASPIISAFGGMFLLMIGISYFADKEKRSHWIQPVEKTFAKVSRFENSKIFLALLVAIIVYYFAPAEIKTPVLVSSIVGILLHLGLDLVSSIFEEKQPGPLAKAKSKLVKKTGIAAFSSFIYLELLDASFSFDGVIGAFAITSNIILIVAGLGVGAIWVRSLTVYLMRAGVLNKYKYLEHGAHWAILALGCVMISKVFGVHLPEAVTGLLGITFIALAIFSSVKEAKHA